MSKSNIINSSKKFKNVFFNYDLDELIKFKNIDYVDIVDDKISFLKGNRINIVEKFDYDYYDNRYRQEMKIGKFLFYITNGKLSTSKIEQIVLKIKKNIKKYNKEYFINIVEGEEIRHWYDQKNYEDGYGTLNNSCMRYSDMKNKFDLYVENPDVCKLIILKENFYDKKIIGRALLWKTNKGLYMDRVYTTYKEDEFYLLEHAKSNNWLNYYQIKDLKLHVKVNRKFNPKSKDYPYLDTFNRYYYLNGILSNYKYSLLPYIYLQNV